MRNVQCLRYSLSPASRAYRIAKPSCIYGSLGICAWISFCEEQICERFVLKYQASRLLWVTCFIMMTSVWLSNLGLIPECKLKGVILLSSPDAVLLRANLSRGTAAYDFNRALTALFASATKHAFAKDNKDTWWLFYPEIQ